MLCTDVHTPSVSVWICFYYQHVCDGCAAILLVTVFGLVWKGRAGGLSCCLMWVVVVCVCVCVFFCGGGCSCFVCCCFWWGVVGEDVRCFVGVGVFVGGGGHVYYWLLLFIFLCFLIN